MKINASEIRVGMLLEYKNDLWQVLKTQHVKPGKGGAFAQVDHTPNTSPFLSLGDKIAASAAVYGFSTLSILGLERGGVPVV